MNIPLLQPSGNAIRRFPVFGGDRWALGRLGSATISPDKQPREAQSMLAHPSVVQQRFAKRPPGAPPGGVSAAMAGSGRLQFPLI